MVYRTINGAICYFATAEAADRAEAAAKVAESPKRTKRRGANK